MKSKIEELLLSKDTSNHKLAFAIISGDEEMIDEYSKLFADEMVKSNYDYNKQYTNYPFIYSPVYTITDYLVTEFCDWNTLRISQTRGGSIINNHKNNVSIYSNDKSLYSSFITEKEELTKTLINWFISFFKSYTE